MSFSLDVYIYIFSSSLRTLYKLTAADCGQRKVASDWFLVEGKLGKPQEFSGLLTSVSSSPHSTNWYKDDRKLR